MHFVIFLPQINLKSALPLFSAGSLVHPVSATTHSFVKTWLIPEDIQCLVNLNLSSWLHYVNHALRLLSLACLIGPLCGTVTTYVVKTFLLNSKPF